MARKKRRPQKYNKTPRVALIAAVFLGTLCTALLSFISLELSIVSFSAFAIGAMHFTENRRRGFWETAASFKFKTLFDRQKDLAKDTVVNSNDIEEIKADISAIRMAMRGLGAGKTSSAPMPLERSPSPFDLELKKAMAEPVRATKPNAPLPPKPAQRENFDGVSDTVVSELLKHALHEKRIDVFVQPVVRLPQRQVRFYEMFARVRARPGQYLPASRYMKVAEQDNMDGKIDNLLLLHCLKTIQASADVERAAPFFINIKRSTLTNAAFMQRLLAFLAKNRSLAPRLIFEIPQKGFENMPPPMLEIMQGLGQLGCCFSLDHVSNIKMNISELMRYKVRFVKIDGDMLSGSRAGQKIFAEMHRCKRKLEANGIGVIAAKIETEKEMQELSDFDVHFGQGYLFGRPDLQGAYKKGARARRVGLQEEVA